MIFVGVGANLRSEKFGAPRRTCEAALAALAARGVRVVRRSPWYRSAPVPPSAQPWFVNAVAEVATGLAPGPLLAQLHAVEAAFGRCRGARDAARVIDLDLLAYGARVCDGADGPILPHPRLHERAFVLLPLRELAAGWVHPRTGAGIDALIAALPAGQRCVVLGDDRPTP